MTDSCERAGPGRSVPYVLAGCTAVSTLSTDLFAPSLPHLPAALGTDAVTAQLTISVNLAAYAIAQLFHGPLADRFGRRALLVRAFLLFAAASVACALATTVAVLIGCRIAQGVFSSVPSVVVVLMIRELYGGTRAVAVMALYGMAVGVAPAVGPIAGGYLQVWFGWEAGFWLVAGLAMAMVAAVLQVVPEPPFEPHPIHFGRTLATYGRLLLRPGYLVYLAPLSLIFGALFAFVTTGPMVFIDLLGVPTERYGLCYLVIVVSYIAGSVVTNRVVKRMTPAALVRAAAMAAMAVAAALMFVAAAGIATAFTILTAMAVYGVALGVVMAAAPILLLDTVADLPQGPASALLGSFQLGAGALAGLISGGLYDGTPLSMLGTIAGFVALGAMPVLFLRRPVTA